MLQIQTIRHSNNKRLHRSVRGADNVAWSQELPRSWKDLVVAPLSFDIFREYEIAADRTIGRDESNTPCYCASRYLVTDLQSDDDDEFYETAAYAESLTAWRLRDERWLIYRTVVGNDGMNCVQRFFTLSESMPR